MKILNTAARVVVICVLVIVAQITSSNAQLVGIEASSPTCQNGPITLTVTGCPQTIVTLYEWHLPDGTISYDGSILASTPGVYSVVSICNAVPLSFTVVGRPVYIDQDEDGFGGPLDPGGLTVCMDTFIYGNYTTIDGDCNDLHGYIFPGAFEVCDGVDNNCDGTVDETTSSLFFYYLDNDHDGYGNTEQGTSNQCTPPVGMSTNNTDCNDFDPNIHPGATEYCNSNDENCNGLGDEPAQTSFYIDNDGDGYGTWDLFMSGCGPVPDGYSLYSTDCNDADANINPSTLYFQDADGDGYGDASGNDTTFDCSVFGGVPAGYVTNAQDCDDTDSTLNPLTPYFPDNDGDGYGFYLYIPAPGTITPCPVPAGWVRVGGDCDDGNAVINPGFVRYLDADGDGYGNPNVTAQGCFLLGSYVYNGWDCNDTTSTVNPGAIEVCGDDIDNNCNGLVDEGTTIAYFPDADGDGYGNNLYIVAPGTLTPCPVPAGWVTNNQDCNDGDATINPETVWNIDFDGDGYGDPNHTYVGCPLVIIGLVLNAEDCDDSLAAVHPGATEECDAIDNNCNGSIDEGVGNNYYVDYDGDLFGDASATPILSCGPVTGYSPSNDDCNDENAGINPAAFEVCDGIDNNCNGLVDEGLAPVAGVINGPSTAVCKGTTKSYSVDAQPIASTYNWTAPANATIASGQGTANVTVSFNNQFSSGNLSVSVSNGCGTSSAQLSIASLPAMPASISMNPGNSNVCKNSTRTFTAAMVVGATSYQWQVPGGASITYLASSPDHRSVSVTFGNKSGDVKVRALNACGASAYKVRTVSLSNCRLDEESSTDISTTRVNLYPNPTTGSFTVEFETSDLSPVTIEVFSATGQHVSTEIVENSKGLVTHRMTLNHLPSGIYTVRVRNATHFVNRSLAIID